MMASMFTHQSRTPRLLDVGAGIGSLTAAWVVSICEQKALADHLTVVAYEVDSLLANQLSETLDACRKLCERVGIDVD